MKEKTSVTLSKDVLISIDRLAGSKHSRSAVIERVLRRFLREHGRAQAQARDLARLNQAAEQLNAEADEVMEYQSPEDGFGAECAAWRDLRCPKSRRRSRGASGSCTSA